MATKKEIQALQALIEERDKQIAELHDAIAQIEQRVLDEISLKLPNDEARQFFAMMSPRTKNRDELVLLIRAIARLEND